MVILDTNIIIDHLRTHLSGTTILERLALKEASKGLGISTLTVQELYAGKSSQNKEKEEILQSILQNLSVFSYTTDIAKLAGEITRDINMQTTFVDAAIGATAIMHNLPLLTINAKHFMKFPNLKLYDLKSLE